jgi:hypothetical protein
VTDAAFPAFTIPAMQRSEILLQSPDSRLRFWTDKFWNRSPGSRQARLEVRCRISGRSQR